MFHFALDPVLNHRRHLEQEAQRHVAAAETCLRQVEADLAACEEAARALAGQWRHECERGLSAGRQELFAAWRQELRRQRAECAARAQEARRSLEKARQRLVVAHRELQKIEHLRRRAWRDHLAQEERRERLFVDDLTVMRHRRRPSAHALAHTQEAKR